jgi:hypothetical protein
MFDEPPPPPPPDNDDDGPPPPPDDELVPPPPPPDADDDLPPPPPNDDEGVLPPPPPPPHGSNATEVSSGPEEEGPQQQQTQSYEQWMAYMQSCKDAGYDVSQLANSIQPSEQQPDWLRQMVGIFELSERESCASADEAASATGAAATDGAASAAGAAATDGWDPRWGYGRPIWRVPTGGGRGRGQSGGGGGRFGNSGPGMPPPGPRRGVFLQRCTAWAGGKGKCKKGQRCPFAHGDAELASKEYRQAVKRRQEEAEALKRSRAAAMADDDRPVRLREAVDGGEDDDGPIYREYEKPAAASACGASDGAAPYACGARSTAIGGGDDGAGGGGGGRGGVLSAAAPHTATVHVRDDGTPLDFSSREAKVEARKQQALERAYEARQAEWGLPVPSSSHHVALPAAVSAGAQCPHTIHSGGGRGGPLPLPASSSTAATSAGGVTTGSGTASQALSRPLPPRGRGRHVVRPAWLVEMEREEALQEQYALGLGASI